MIRKQLKKWWPAIMLTAISLQPAAAQNVEKTFSGKPILTLFANYKAGLGHKNKNSGFNIDRAFVGYEAFFAKGFSAKILMNVETVADENGNTKFNGYLKNAQIDWKGYGFFVSAGLVNLKQFSEQRPLQNGTRFSHPAKIRRKKCHKRQKFVENAVGQGFPYPYFPLIRCNWTQ